MANVPSFFGPAEGVDSKDYLLLMAGDTPTSSPISLIGHALTNPSADSSNALTVTRVELRNGKIKTVVRTKRAAEVRSRSYTIGFPAGALWSPAQQAALRQGCRKTFYMKYLCAEDRRYSHAEIFPDALMDAPVEAGDLITIDDATLLSATSNLTVTDKERLWALGWNKVYDGADKFDAVAFQSVDCPTCSDVPGLSMFAAGGNGTLAPTVSDTDDRFSTVAARVTGATAGDNVMALATKGNVVVIGTADKRDATAASGSLRVSTDSGVTYTAVAGITLPIYDIVFAGDSIVAVGGIAAGAAKMYVSADKGASWTTVVNTVLPATGLKAVSYDAATGKIYAAGAAKLISAVINGATVTTMTDISANVAGIAGLSEVHVFSQDFLAVGGASGFYAESIDGGATFTYPGVPGSDAVNGIAGDKHRQVVVTDTAVCIRDVMNDFVYTSVTLENGQTVTGNYTDVQMNLENDRNIFVAVTDAAEVVIGTPFYPNA